MSESNEKNSIDPSDSSIQFLNDKESGKNDFNPLSLESKSYSSISVHSFVIVASAKDTTISAESTDRLHLINSHLIYTVYMLTRNNTVSTHTYTPTPFDHSLLQDTELLDEIITSHVKLMPDFFDGLGYQLYINAIRAGNPIILNLLLPHIALTVKDNPKKWALHPDTKQVLLIDLYRQNTAVSKAMIEELLRHGVIDPNISGKNGGFHDTAVNYMSEQEDIPMLKLLLKYNANPRQGIFNAFNLKKMDVLAVLLEHGVDPNFAFTITRREAVVTHPLIKACESISVQMVTLLLKHGADVSLTDSKGVTPLDALLGKRHISDEDELTPEVYEIVTLLMEYHPDTTEVLKRISENHPLRALILSYHHQEPVLK